jgi:steroid 5-alpha reductase family enzyme
MQSSEWSRGKSFAIVIITYVVAILVGIFVELALESHYSRLVAFAVADAVATVVVFVVSVLVNNSSMYDPYWSVAPMVIAPALALRSDAPLMRKVMVVALVLLWGARLTWNWARGWSGLGHEDFRYVDLRKTTGKAYWLVSFFGLHFMPTVMVFLGCLSLFGAFEWGNAPVGALDVVGVVVTLSAIAVEARADKELRIFRLTNKEPGKILDTGIWSYCRHPNYLGEVLFWWGLSSFALAAKTSGWWVIVGPASIHALFVFVSIPLMTKRALARRADYQARMESVPALFPRPWRKVIQTNTH